MAVKKNAVQDQIDNLAAGQAAMMAILSQLASGIHATQPAIADIAEPVKPLATATAKTIPAAEYANTGNGHTVPGAGPKDRIAFARHVGDNFTTKADFLEYDREGKETVKSKKLFFKRETQQQLVAAMMQQTAPKIGLQMINLDSGEPIGNATPLTFKPSASATRDGQKNYMLAADKGMLCHVDCAAGVFTIKTPAGVYFQFTEKHPAV